MTLKTAHTCPALNRSLRALAATVLSTATLLALADDAPPTDGLWRGTGGAAVSANSGNTESVAAQLKVEAARLTEADKIGLGANLTYARNTVDGEDSTSANKMGAYGQYDFNLGPNLLAFGRLELARDQLTDLDLRTAIAAGMGWKLINRKDTRFTVFAGLGHTADRYGSVQTIDGKIDDRFSRNSVLLAEESQHALTPSISFKQRLSIQPGISGDKGTLANFTADLAVALNSTMSLSVGVVNAYDSQPPEGRKSNDLGLFTGINVKFGAL
jgi:putative salt-induced outer membrane protein